MHNGTTITELEDFVDRVMPQDEEEEPEEIDDRITPFDEGGNWSGRV